MKQIRRRKNSVIKLVMRSSILALLVLIGFFAGCDSKSSRSPYLDAGAATSIPSNTHFVFGAQGWIPTEDVTVNWQQISGLPVTINDSESLNASFLSPQVFTEQTLVFQVQSTNSNHEILTDQIEINVYPIKDLSNAEFAFSQLPALNQPFSIHIVNDDNFGFIRWEIAEAPFENVPFTLSDDRKSAHFELGTRGLYRLKITSDTGQSIRSIHFTLREQFPFNPNKIENNDGSKPISEIAGIILNQSWIIAPQLTDTEVKERVESEPLITWIGFDESQGTLVEFDETLKETELALGRIKNRTGIHTIEPRWYEGDEFIKIESTVLEPDDYSDWTEKPAGDNWHLEIIDAPDAWKISSGNPAVQIGISDGGFETNHPELQGRVLEELVHTEKVVYMDHGNGVAGAIAAVTNNQQGMAGINWQSQVLLSGNSYDGVLSLTKYKNTRVISSSWAIPGYIQKDFDPTNAQQANQRKADAIKATRQFRTLAKQHPDKLFVWSAGNGINNGKGYKNVYGIEGQFHSPALHLSQGGEYAPLDNVIFVASHNIKKSLYYYSNYGKLIDLAAPAHFKSLTATDYKNFLGTSAATPVVAGIASLVFSMNPEFSAADVKQLLISSAKTTIEKRQTTPSKTAELGSTIPMINALEAVKATQDRLENKLKWQYTLSNPFETNLTLIISPYLASSKITAISGELLQKTGEGVPLQLVNQFSDSFSETASENTASSSLGFTASSLDYQIKAAIDLKTKDGVDKTVETTLPIAFSSISLDLKDQESGQKLGDASIYVENLSIDETYPAGKTDINGDATLWLKPGHYKISGEKPGFKPISKNIAIQALESQALTLRLFPVDVQGLGGLDGLILNTQGLPIENATVRLSGGAQTNGVIRLSQTTEKGLYSFHNVSLFDNQGNEITDFTLEVSARGYNPVSMPVTLLSDLTRTENILLTTIDSPIDTILMDDSETEKGWLKTGLWHRINLSENNILNRIQDQGFAQTPSQHEGEALLPDAPSGHFSYWYGKSDTGSYINKQSTNDFLLSGGTSKTSHHGELISPAINLIDTNKPTLFFKTWWEIEATLSNRDGFDQMTIWISTDGKGSFEELRQLNPLFSPVGNNIEDKPFSSAGFDQPPVWVEESVDLSAYKDQVIHIKFQFDTKDALSNGFRGWLIDDIAIIDR